MLKDMQARAEECNQEREHKTAGKYNDDGSDMDGSHTDAKARMNEEMCRRFAVAFAENSILAGMSNQQLSAWPPYHPFDLQSFVDEPDAKDHASIAELAV